MKFFVDNMSSTRTCKYYHTLTRPMCDICEEGVSIQETTIRVRVFSLIRQSKGCLCYSVNCDEHAKCPILLPKNGWFNVTACFKQMNRDVNALIFMGGAFYELFHETAHFRF